jgi:hypothetical protein
MLADATADTFRPHVGTGFAVEVENGEPLVITLDEVEVHPGGGLGQRAEPFTLVFSGPFERTAPQATLRLSHDVLGQLDIFLVPLGPGRYEAVFS